MSDLWKRPGSALFVRSVNGHLVTLDPGGEYVMGPDQREHEKHEPVAPGDTVAIVNTAGNGDILVDIIKCQCRTLLTPKPN